MTAPIHTIVDHIPHTEDAYYVQVFDNLLYPSGSEIRRFDLSTNTATVVAPGHGAGASTIVDFHQPIDPPPDILGVSERDRRIYFATGDGRVGEIVPALNDQFREIQTPPSLIACIKGANSGKSLYFQGWGDEALVVIDLSQPWPQPPHVIGTIQLKGIATSIVVSPDDRFIYVAHPVEETLSVLETGTWPPKVNVVPVANGPCSLALSTDGKRLFVAQCGYVKPTSHTGYGSGSLTMFDTETMQGRWLYTGRCSVDVVLNAAGTRAYVSNNEAHTVSVVDVSDDMTVIDTIEGFNSPGHMALSSDEKRLYVTQAESKKDIAVVAI